MFRVLGIYNFEYYMKNIWVHSIYFLIKVRNRTLGIYFVFTSNFESFTYKITYLQRVGFLCTKYNDIRSILVLEIATLAVTLIWVAKQIVIRKWTSILLSFFAASREVTMGSHLLFWQGLRWIGVLSHMEFRVAFWKRFFTFVS